MRVRSALSVLAIAMSVTLSGCAPTSGSAPAPTPPAAPAKPPAPAPASTVAPGRAQVIVNGDTGPTGPVDCSAADGLVTMSVGDSSLGVSVVVTDDEQPQVRSVSIGDVGGVALGFAVGAANSTVPTARRNGDTVIVSGTGSGTDSANPARVVDSSYQIAGACP